jgi:DNA uptake protein ComE-like DNA-binding protein
MGRRATVLALFAVAVFAGFRYCPPEAKESIQKRFSDVYTSCLEHPYVALTIEGVSPYVSSGVEVVGSYVTSAIEKFWQALARVNIDSEGSKEWLIANTSWIVAKTSERLAVFSEGSKQWLVAKTSWTVAKTSDRLAVFQLLNSKIVAASKARVLATSSQVLLWLRGLSPMHRTTLAVAVIAMVMMALALSCRRRRPKVNASVDDTVVAAQLATSDARTETGAQDALRRRRSRCDSPRPTNGNDENAAPQSNRLEGSESLLSQVNTATSDELLRLPGLGEKSVAKILKYRSKHGDIQEIDELIGKVGLARVVVTKLARVHSS